MQGNISEIKNVTLERELLGAIFIREGEIMSDLITVIVEGDFTNAQYRVIYIALCDMFFNGKTITPTFLVEELNQLGKNELCSTVLDLANAVPTNAHWRETAKVLKEYTKRRRLAVLASSVYESSFNSTSDELLALINKGIDGIDDVDDEGLPSFKDAILEYNDEIERRLGGELPTTLPTGYPDLDRLIDGFDENQLIILGARPAVGKSALAINLATNISKKGKKVAYFSLEMSRKQILNRVIVSTDGRFTLQDLKHPEEWTEEQVLDYTDVLGKINAVGELMISDATDLRVSKIKSLCREKKRKGGLDFVVIDHMGLLKGEQKSYGGSRNAEVSEISRSLKEMAMELKVPVLALCQLNRDVEKQADKRPALKDLRDSGSIEQDADTVMFLYRDGYYQTLSGEQEPSPAEGQYTELIIAKQRDGRVGKVGLVFFGERTRFKGALRPCDSVPVNEKNIPM